MKSTGCASRDIAGDGRSEDESSGHVRYLSEAAATAHAQRQVGRRGTSSFD